MTKKKTEQEVREDLLIAAVEELSKQVSKSVRLEFNGNKALEQAARMMGIKRSWLSLETVSVGFGGLVTGSLVTYILTLI